MKTNYIVQIVCAVAFFLGSLTCNAQDCMLLYTKSKASVILMLKDRPRISFENDAVTVGQQRYEFDDIDKYVFADAASVADVEGCADFIVTADGLVRISVADGNVEVYNPSGVLISVPVKECGDYIELDFTIYTPGVYILKTGTKSFKVKVR